MDAKLSEASDRQIAIADRLARTSIRAPLDGTLYELSVHTIGGVITPAAQLGTVVPQGAELKIEAHIAPADIDQVSVGQPARLKFSTFNQSVTPDIPGRVTYVSAATSRDAATNQTYYVADVEISEMSNLQGRELKPGMLVDVFITTQERTAMSYLVKPLTDKFGRLSEKNSFGDSNVFNEDLPTRATVKSSCQLSRLPTDCVRSAFASAGSCNA